MYERGYGDSGSCIGRRWLAEVHLIQELDESWEILVEVLRQIRVSEEHQNGVFLVPGRPRLSSSKEHDADTFGSGRLLHLKLLDSRHVEGHTERISVGDWKVNHIHDASRIASIFEHCCEVWPKLYSNISRTGNLIDVCLDQRSEFAIGMDTRQWKGSNPHRRVVASVNPTQVIERNPPLNVRHPVTVVIDGKGVEVVVASFRAGVGAIDRSVEVVELPVGRNQSLPVPWRIGNSICVLRMIKAIGPERSGGFGHTAESEAAGKGKQTQSHGRVSIKEFLTPCLLRPRSTLGASQPADPPKR